MNLFKRLFHRRPEPSESTTLTGDWLGHYEQHHARRRIAATLIQEGDRLSGHMRDLETDTTSSLYEAVAHAGLPPGTDEKFDEQIRAMIPNAGREPIVVRSILPTDAVLKGRINGEFVRFTKTYQGESEHRYEIGSQGVGYKIPGHAVEYSGRLSPDRMTITGKWTVTQPGAPRGFLDGSFELTRSDSSGSTGSC